ncbi:MAG: hypothetical protein K2K97_04720 [Muribaculaceae bacterium]|nr:hypothetical protein [Muribaculaceae bacterium]
MNKLLERNRRPDISFNSNGTIRIAARVARMLSLLPGDAINIAVTDGEYLLFAIRYQNVDCRYEAQCYRSKRGGGENYCANSVRLCRALMKAVGAKSERVSYSAGEAIERDGIKYVPIITLHPL